MDVSEILWSPPAARPAVLEGKWLGQNGNGALVASKPVSVLEGGSAALDQLPTWLEWHARRHPAGAAIGFLSYELARFFESLTLPKFEFLPDLSIAYYPRIQRVPRTKPFTPKARDVYMAEGKTNFDEESFAQAVEKIRDYLAAGDIYQANLTQQFLVSLDGQLPEQIYDWLGSGRASFRAFLKAPGRAVISNSPERFFRVAEGRILASPIKGTIARRGDGEEDQKRAAQLLSSAKDCAENIMIVDLLRNDLGRICRPGSITAQLFELDPLPHLFHLVSHVRGTLQPGVGLLDIFRALFPCGSVTGAPKIRAMEILAEIERVPRGVSMGAIGIILGAPGSDRFEMDFNVAIRTMLIREGEAIFNVGGGIVYDSTARAEYEEMMLKAKPLLEALRAARPRELRATPANTLER